jgi:histidinol-phosphatase (PHP family)
LLASYHNHSNWSDGKASPRDIHAAAQAMRLDEVGISDHWVLHPRGTQFPWAMKTDALNDYVLDVAALRDEARRRGGPTLRIGLEVDWFQGHADALSGPLHQHHFDYLIASVHQVAVAGVGEFMIDGSAASWSMLTDDQRNAIYRQYWINMKSLAESGLFDIAAHLDLPKKFAFYPTIDLSREIHHALDAIADSPRELVVELNTAGWHKPCEDAYPTLDILRECRRRDIKVTLNADAHQPEHLLRDFERGAARLAEAGYTHVARFANRTVRLEPLSQAVP